MNLKGRRQSSNVEDQRGNGGKIAAGGGIVGIIIAGIMLLLNGGDPTELLQQTMNSQASPTQKYTSSPEEDSLFVFASQILASTEDVWTAEFKKMGRTYRAPKLKIFHGSVQSGCGGATSETGPFYCSADECVYLDLEFFMSMKKTLGADGDFAYAYVIAHEVGHHVQHLLGTLDEAHKAMRSASKTESNQISVRLELQADFYAGVWGYHENEMFGSLEPGDIEEATGAAGKIGDDYLQKKGQGYSVPDSFTHGTSAQRTKWLKKGLQTGNIKLGDTFSPSYNSL
ncbi:MAG: neutral zinc metallopeptidase [Bacteroidales bacterium]|nr:neutral zinc metallopeptidase [Bacteroidales bacterium]